MEELINKAEALYKERPEILCPYFKENIHLNTKGFEHILFKKRDVRRKESDQLMRFKLLKFVPEILAKSHTLQGVEETIEWVKQKKHGRWEKIPKKLWYFEFIAVIEKVRIKIVVKQPEDGAKYFWSIIPFWRIKGVDKKRILHEGNPEID